MSTLDNYSVEEDVPGAAAAQVKPVLVRSNFDGNRVRALMPPQRRATIYRNSFDGSRVRSLAAPQMQPLLWRRGPSQTRMYNLLISGQVTLFNKTLSNPYVEGIVRST